MLYEFGSSFTFVNQPRGMAPAAVQGAVQPVISIDPYAAGLSQSAHVEGGRTPSLWEEHRVEPGDVEEFIEPGFRYLDAAMKSYWGDMRIPTKDSFRFIRSKIAGASKSLQVWTDELRHGRVKLPVISVSRTSHEYNPQKFTPPYGALRTRFVNPARTRIALHYRPVPYLVEYKLDVWAEHKRDAEYIIYQILTRFNPLAEVKVSDGHNYGCVQLRFGSSSDTSDKEATFDQQAKIKYEITFTAEAWLPIPEKIVPSILGKVSATELI